jgi:hypothetical protein
MTTPYELGRHVEHDEASRAFRAAQAGGPLVSVIWKRSGDVFDQGQVGSCTGNAIAGVMNTAPLRKRYTRRKTEADALRAYELATTLDSVPGAYPPDDTGSSGLAVCKAAVKLGWITAYHHAFGMAEALGALMLQPVIVGTNWYESMFKPDASGTVSISPGSSVAGGHEYEVLGVDVEGKRVLCANSWGAAWGVHGLFWMSWDTFNRLLSEQGDVTVPIR